MAHSNKDKRSAIRRAKKMARKASWISLIGTSKNQKKKLNDGGSRRKLPTAKVAQLFKAIIRGKAQMIKRMVHTGPRCWNTGCLRCNPSLIVR